LNKPLLEKRRCKACHQYLPEKKPDGGNIVYGEGTGYLALTPEGRKLMMKSMISEWQRNIIEVCSYVIGKGVKGELTADDSVYVAASELLQAAIDNFPKRVK